MLGKKTAGRIVKNSTLSGKRARMAAKAAKKAYASKSGSRPTGWKKGGREWSRVLGHFGLSTNGSSDK